MQTNREFKHPALAQGALHFIKQVMHNPEMEKIFWDLLYNRMITLEEQCIMRSFLEVIPEEDLEKGQALSLEGGLYLFTSYDYKNIVKGVALLEKAINAGNVCAINNLGYFYEHRSEKNEEDYKKAASLYKQAISLHHPAAMCNLGDMYEYGLGKKKNLEKTFALNQQAADMNYVRGIYNLGRLYYYREHSARNLTEATRLFRKAGGDNAISWLRHMQQDYQDNLSVQYHVCMALTPGKLFSLFKKSPQTIGEYLFHDELLTDEQKRSFLSNELYVNCLEEVDAYSLLADWNFYWAQSDENNKKQYCETALYYFQKGDAKKKHPFYCYLAAQYIQEGNYEEAITFCLQSLDYVPSRYLLAHILLIDLFGFDRRSRDLLCLYLLHETTTIATFIDRDSLVDRLLDSLNYGKFTQNTYPKKNPKYAKSFT